MYSLKHIGNNKYSLILGKTKKYTSSFNNLILVAIQAGFSSKELLAAKSDMDKKFHDSSEFGVYKTFIFSYNEHELTQLV